MTLKEQERMLQLVVQEIERMKGAMEFVFHLLMQMPEFTARYNEVLKQQQKQQAEQMMKSPIILKPQ